MNKQQLQSNRQRRVLIVSRDVIGEQVAGPGVRYLEMARRLTQKGHRVTLMAPELHQWPEGDGFTVQAMTGTGFNNALLQNEVVISQGFAYSAWTVATTGAIQIFDFYAPLQLEMLEAGQAGHASAGEAAFYRRYVALRLRLLMAHGDFFICASERQRDLWLGSLASAGRLNRANFQQHTDLRGLIDCVPFGTPTEPFPGSGDRAADRREARAAIEGIDDNDFLLLWGGGIWPWLDARTAIRAAVLATEKQPRVKLLFLGSGHPNPGVTTGEGAEAQARECAEDLGALGKTVLFNEHWVPFGQRIGFLTAADAGLLAHKPGIETRYAFRTRLLDCFWAGLPVIATSGDELSSTVRHNGAGTTVPPENPEALAAAIVSLAEDRELQEKTGAGSAGLGERYRWDRIFAPLERFVERPHTRRSRGEHGIPATGRWSAVRYTAAVIALGVRHGLWRRALAKLKTGARA